MIRTDSALEVLLETEAKTSTNAFPRREVNYFNMYCSIKAALNEKYYQSTSAGLAMTTGGRYTKHDMSHVDDVIETAGDLLGAGHGDNLLDKLAPYEVFVLLVAILLHDAGNARGRERHELEPRRILADLGALVLMDDLEKRMIGSVASAHGGYGPGGEKDTIGTWITDPVAVIAGKKVHGRRLAALLRLADELSERPTRADRQALVEPHDSPESVLHNLYCVLINSHIDYISRSVSIEFNLDRNDLVRLYSMREGDDVRQVYIVDYIAMRLDKCERERQYCNGYLSDLIIYRRLRVVLRIFDNSNNDLLPIDEITLELPPTGYPKPTNTVAELKPEFSGAALEMKHRRSATEATK